MELRREWLIGCKDLEAGNKWAAAVVSPGTCPVSCTCQ